MVFGLWDIERYNIQKVNFQFPVGIRWCSDVRISQNGWCRCNNFQFPVGIRWCSDMLGDGDPGDRILPFQFPVGIRWCSDSTQRNLPSSRSCTFNSLWELDGVRTGYGAELAQVKWFYSFNSLWELDGVRTAFGRLCMWNLKSFNSLWELDGVRTLHDFPDMYRDYLPPFQFPVGIRWCSDKVGISRTMITEIFQFPVGIRWCSDYWESRKTIQRRWLSIPCGN